MPAPSLTTGAHLRVEQEGWKWLLALGAAIGLTWIFFPTLWSGGGLVGGDIYAYVLPQKQYLAEQLQAGVLPLWNPRTGHGYPALAESQTGVLYPPNALFACLPLNTAYNVLQGLHYVLAFIACAAFARRRGMNWASACLMALTYTFSWLPPRISLEWAAIGAAYLPVVLWQLESHLQTGRMRYWIAACLALALQMLAGHFQVAFMTQVLALSYWTWRIWYDRSSSADCLRAYPLRHWLFGLLLLGLAFGVAAAQLLPTWELKQLSQRAELGGMHDPGYGYLPWWYLPQMIAPWSYYGHEFYQPPVEPGVSRTNAVEAHLYLGLIPLGLALWAIVRGLRLRQRDVLAWSVVSVAGIVIATGVLVPVLKYLPGFGFFNGIGRFSLLVTIAGAYLAGQGWMCVTQKLSTRWNCALFAGVMFLTVCDFRSVAQHVAVAVAVPRPPLFALEHSPIRKALAEQQATVRLFAPGANLPNLLGVSSTPVYLGLSPGVYYDPQWMLPQPWPFETPATPEHIDWLRRAGVTHILSFKPLAPSAWPARLLTATPDPFLNAAWARGSTELMYLYQLHNASGRLQWQGEHQDQAIAHLTHSSSNRVEILTDSPTAGTLLLTELDWPGWNVTIDDQPAAKARLPGFEADFRSVVVPAGQHRVTWTFQPPSVWWGALSSGISLFLLAALAHVAFWHPALVRRMQGQPTEIHPSPQAVHATLSQS